MARKRPAPEKDKTRVEQIIDRLKSHRILAWVIVAGIALTALEPVLNIVDRLRSLVGRGETSQETAAPTAGASEPKPVPASAPPSAPAVQKIGAAVELVNIVLTSLERTAVHNDVVLDIQLRNRGDEVAFLSKAVVRFERFGRLRPLGHEPQNAMSKVKSSARYFLTFTPECVPYAPALAVSQAIKPNDVDRFRLTLQTSPSLEFDETVYLANLELIYNEDGKRVNGPNLLMILPELPATLCTCRPTILLIRREIKPFARRRTARRQRRSPRRAAS